MHLLHRVLEQRPELRDIIHKLSERTANNPLKHALVLDVNPFWLAAYQLDRAGLPHNALDYLFFPGALWSYGGGGVLDFNRRFPSAEVRTGAFRGHKNADQSEPHLNPFLLRIFALPASETDGKDFEYRSQLVGAARETPLFTIVETQEMARLTTAAGDSVFSAPNARGTVGGFLRDDQPGTTYAVTCGHVISSGASAFTSAGRLGQCTYAAAPKALPAGSICSVSCGHMTTLDLALIDIRGASATNIANRIANIVSPGDIVEMGGATSGLRRYEVGGAVVEHTIAKTCWDRLYLVHAPCSAGVLPVAVNVAITPPPRGGDSGAWLIRGGSDWAGMVVASNAIFGFALAGTTIVSEAYTSFGMNLRLA